MSKEVKEKAIQAAEKAIKVAADLGNSKTKLNIKEIGEDIILQPSVVKYHYKRPITFPKSLSQAVNELQNELHLNIQSDALSLSGIYSVGTAALKQDQAQNMDIEIGTTKDKSDIPVIMLLSMIAAEEIKQYFQEHNALPELLKLSVELVTALPASQYRESNVNNLKKRLNGTHIISLFVNENTIPVHIRFSEVNVTSEGVPPLIYLAKNKKEIFTAANFKPMDADGKIRDIDLNKVKSVHSDIGDGTHEQIVAEGLTPVFTECSGSRTGVGHAVQKAIEILNEEREIELNRQEFMEMLQGDSRKKRIVKSMLDRTKLEEANKILAENKKKCAKNIPDLLVVYGGGSIAFEHELKEHLQKYCDAEEIDLLWIPEKYAINMNIEGLKLLLG